MLNSYFVSNNLFQKPVFGNRMKYHTSFRFFHMNSISLFWISEIPYLYFSIHLISLKLMEILSYGSPQAVLSMVILDILLCSYISLKFSFFELKMKNTFIKWIGQLIFIGLMSYGVVYISCITHVTSKHDSKVNICDT